MSLRSQEHRAASWDKLVCAEGDDRALWFNVVAELLHADVGPCVDLYSPGYVDLFVESLQVIDAASVLDELRDPYLAIDGNSVTAPEEFVASMVRLLADAADLAEGEAAQDANKLFQDWRDHLLHRNARDDDYLSVAEVAGIYQVTPQAVYKWIRAGKVPAESTPGGGRHRIPRSALTTTRDQEVAIDAL